MTEISKDEALVILDRFDHITVRDLRQEQDGVLLKLIVRLINYTNRPAKVSPDGNKIVEVHYVVHSPFDLITAIKVYRYATKAVLKEAKDAVELAVKEGREVNVGTMTRDALLQLQKLIDEDKYLKGVVHWSVYDPDNQPPRFVQ